MEAVGEAGVGVEQFSARGASSGAGQEAAGEGAVAEDEFDGGAPGGIRRGDAVEEGMEDIAGGGGATLTPPGADMLERYDAFVAEVCAAADAAFEKRFGEE